MAHNDYYKKLTESLNRKYLTEAWSDNMPDWLKPRLSSLAMIGKSEDELQPYAERSKNRDVINTPSWNKVWAYRQSKGGARDPFVYRKPRNGPKATNLFDGFKKAGIDLTSVFFVDDSDNPPTKKSDPRVNFPNIGIWHFSNGQVYAQGMNDLEKCKAAPYDSPLYEKIFSRVPIKDLSDMCDHFCYIDGSSIDKSVLPNKAKERSEYADWRSENPQERRATQKEINRSFYWSAPDPTDVTRERYDRSGYYVVPSSKRLRNELNKRRAVTWSNWFKDVEDKLVDLKSDIDSAMLSRTWDDMSFMNDLGNVTNQAHQAIYCYKEAMERVERLINRYGENSDEFLSHITDSCKDYLVRSDKYIENAREYLDKYVLSRIDF